MTRAKYRVGARQAAEIFRLTWMEGWKKGIKHWSQKRDYDEDTHSDGR